MRKNQDNFVKSVCHIGKMNGSHTTPMVLKSSPTVSCPKINNSPDLSLLCKVKPCIAKRGCPFPVHHALFRVLELSFVKD